MRRQRTAQGFSKLLVEVCIGVECEYRQILFGGCPGNAQHPFGIAEDVRDLRLVRDTHFNGQCGQ